MAFVTAVRGCECCWAVAIVAVWFHFLSSPDGSYTEEQSQEGEVKVLATDFDDEFDEEEPLPAIGTCKALYTFEGNLRPPGSLLAHTDPSAVIGPSSEAFQIFLSLLTLLFCSWSSPSLSSSWLCTLPTGPYKGTTAFGELICST